MVRFSCFSTNIHYHRSKKEVRQSAESMSKASEDHSLGRLKASGVPSSLAPKSLKESYDKPSSRTMDRDTSFPGDHSLKPGEIHSDSSPEATIVVHQKTGLKKSHSLGSALNRGGRVSDGIDSEDEIDRDFSCDGSDEKNYAGVFDVIDRNVVEETFGCKDPRENFLNKYANVSSPESFQGNNEVVPSQPIFSIEATKQLVTGDRDVANPSTHGYAGDSGDRTPDTPSIIAKSCSLPNFDLLQPTSKDGSPSPREGSPSPREGSPCHASVVPRCKSFEDLSAVTEKNKVIENHAVDFPAMEDQERGNGMPAYTEDNYEDLSRERYGYDSCNYHFGKDWNMSTSDEVERVKEHEGETSIQNLNALPNKDFKIKRIEEWVNMIDLEDSSSLQDMNEAPLSIDRAKKGSYVLGSACTAKLDPKSTHGMEVAKNYVSSLPAASTSAQLASLGLAVIPFLSAFVNLKTLNLSSNAIVRITSGALPRGLHVLNLAKNNISSIEGLRELSRLRVLDLSYNRILRIGHGLASCSSLKELYLAGNKISEVEGLHRLLKLNVLDLRFNKISTAKCLGQLAANYSSLQAVNLEGNPAQRNVGDEQLKKYLQSILPHLVYYNKQTIRASSKEATDRSSRSTIASHQSDRGLRSEHKLIRKGNHIVPAAKASSSSSHAHRSQAASSSKQSKDRLGRLPPSGTKVSHRHHYLELGSKLLGLRSDSSMRRSRSEGNLGEGNLGAS